MLKNNSEGVTVVCNCGCKTTLEALDFDDARDTIKAEGWKTRKTLDGYEHYAPGHEEDA